MRKVRFISMKEREAWMLGVADTINKMKGYIYPDLELISKNEDFLYRIINNYKIEPFGEKK